MTTNQNSGNSSVEQAIEISIRLGLIALLVIFCFNILSPFISLVLWAAVIAVAMSKPFGALQKKLGGSRKLAVTVFIVLGLGLILTPSVMFFESLIESTTSMGQGIADGTVQVEPPNDSVKDWPLIGERVHTA
jgi:predicted PurR-regulated permease PerM